VAEKISRRAKLRLRPSTPGSAGGHRRFKGANQVAWVSLAVRGWYHLLTVLKMQSEAAKLAPEARNGRSPRHHTSPDLFGSGQLGLP
jgi:hypothetical protein